MPEAGQRKKCTKCQAEKPIDEFGILKKSKDGHNSLCFECKRDYDRDSRTKKTRKAKAADRRSRPEKAKTAETVEKKITVKHEESAEDGLIRAFKKKTIKNFIKNDLIPMLDKAVEEKFA